MPISTTSRLLLRSLLGALLLLGLTARVAAQPRYDHEDRVEETFKVRPGGTLTLRSDLGSISVEGTSSDEVRITVVKGADDMSEQRAEELFDRFTLSMQPTAEGVEIEGNYDRESRWTWRSGLRVHYTIAVPRAYNLRLNTSGGSIELAALSGTADVHTSGGSIRIDDVDGKLRARTSGGSITATRIGDEAELRTSGGSIKLADIDGPVSAHTSGGSITAEAIYGPLDAGTSGGSIRLAAIHGAVQATTSGGAITAEIVGQPGEDMSLKTSGGSVTLELDDDVRADIDARASGGRVRSDLAIAVQGEIERSRLQGTLNGGGPLLTLRTSGGSVNIRER